jgi:hypothetical protein
MRGAACTAVRPRSRGCCSGARPYRVSTSRSCSGRYSSGASPCGPLRVPVVCGSTGQRPFIPRSTPPRIGPQSLAAGASPLWAGCRVLRTVTQSTLAARQSDRRPSTGRSANVPGSARERDNQISAKKAAMSRARSSGSSAAAKCPPLGIEVHRRTSYSRSAHSRGGLPSDT